MNAAISAALWTAKPSKVERTMKNSGRRSAFTSSHESHFRRLRFCEFEFLASLLLCMG